mgnify:CR=1 FL=1
MNNALNKIKAWYQNLTTKSVSFEKKGIKPRRDWIKIVISISIITILLISVSVYFYTKVSNGTLFNVPEKEEISEIEVNRKLLNKFVEDYDSREKALIELKEGRSVPANPAL